MASNYARHIGQKQGTGRPRIEPTGELVFFDGAAPLRVLESAHLWAFYRMPTNVDRNTFAGKLIGVSQ